jgi:transposase InsO family protein
LLDSYSLYPSQQVSDCWRFANNAKPQGGWIEIVDASEIVLPTIWAKVEEFQIGIVTWIEEAYHRRNCKSILGEMTPVEYEAALETLVH